MLTIVSPRLRGALLAAPLLLVALAGCSAQGPAETADAGSPQPQSSSPASSPEYLAWELKITQCLRDAGLDVNDPDPVKGVDDSAMSDPGFSAAFASCQESVGQPPLGETTGGDQAGHALALRQAACLREEGLTVPDPTADGALRIPDGEVVTDAIAETCLSGK